MNGMYQNRKRSLKRVEAIGNSAQPDSLIYTKAKWQKERRRRKGEDFKKQLAVHQSPYNNFPIHPLNREFPKRVLLTFRNV